MVGPGVVGPGVVGPGVVGPGVGQGDDGWAELAGDRAAPRDGGAGPISAGLDGTQGGGVAPGGATVGSSVTPGKGRGAKDVVTSLVVPKYRGGREPSSAWGSAKRHDRLIPLLRRVVGPHRPGQRGGPHRPGQRGRFSGRRRLPLVVGGVVLVALVVMAVLLSQLTGSPGPGGSKGAVPRSGSNSGPARQLTTLKIAGGVLFDHTTGVPGNQDPGENPAQIPNLYDGNPSTSWSTAQYKGRFAQSFGNLKPGVGVVLELANVDKLSQLQILSSPGTLGWQASIYVSNQVQCTLGAWGSPVASQTATTTTTTFNLGKVQGSEVLVWLTKLGPAAQATLDEATLTGSVGSASATVPGTAVCGGSSGS